MGEITLIRFDDAGIAEIVLYPSASSEHVLDAGDLARLLLVHGITVAKVANPNPAEAPGIKVARNVKED